jgi:phage gp29-like protein
MGLFDNFVSLAPGMGNRMRASAQAALAQAERGFSRAVSLAADAAVGTSHRTSFIPMGTDAYGDSAVSVNDLMNERRGIPPAHPTHQIQPVNIPSWTVPEVRSALDVHELGTFFSSAQLMDAMGRDDRIDACLGTRVRALAGKSGVGFTVAPADNVKDPKLAQEIADKVQKYWYYSCPENVMSHLLRDAVMLGVAFARIHWDLVDGIRVPRLEPWHAHTVYWDWSIQKYRAVAREGMFIIEPGSAEWFVYEPGGYRSWMSGAVRGLGLPFVIRQYTYRDWYRYCEKHGMPILAIKEPVGAMWERHKAGFWGKVQRLGAESTLRLPFSEKDGDGFGVEFVEPKDKSWATFQAMIGELNTNIAIRLLGQNLSTEVKGGSFAAAMAQELVRMDYLDADAQTLSTALREQVWKPFVRFNCQGVAPAYAPVPTWDTRPPEDKAAKATVFKTYADALKVFIDPDVRRAAPVDFALMSAGMGVDLLDEVAIKKEQEASSKSDVVVQRDVPQQDMQYGILTKNEIRRIKYGMGPMADGNKIPVVLKPQDPPVDPKDVAAGNADAKKPELFAYHLEYGLLSKNEARRMALNLPPVKDGNAPATPMVAPPPPGGGPPFGARPAAPPFGAPSDTAKPAPSPDGDSKLMALAVAPGGTGKHGGNEAQRVVARSAVNQKVRSGKLPHPNDVPCVVCGHSPGTKERRHEYDHTKGYAPEHHLDVESVCTECHKKRSLKEYGRLFALQVSYDVRQVCGIDITIDRPAGTVQNGVDQAGVPWTRTYTVDYGFVADTLGGDGDAIDVFCGPNDDAKTAFWIVQYFADGVTFDEYKLMLGFNTMADAVACYSAHVPPQYIGNTFSMPVAAVKALLGMDPSERFTVLSAARFTPSDVTEATTTKKKRGANGRYC